MLWESMHADIAGIPKCKSGTGVTHTGHSADHEAMEFVVTQIWAHVSEPPFAEIMILTIKLVNCPNFCVFMYKVMNNYFLHNITYTSNTKWKINTCLLPILTHFQLRNKTTGPKQN